jgi:hypothetical protein
MINPTDPVVRNDAARDAAIVDTRVLMAAGTGARRRPGRARRTGMGDLLLADAIADPWLRALTGSAAAAPIRVDLGGHTLVGPGLRLVLGRRGSARWT